MKIIQSNTSKIVFLIIAVSVCAGFFLDKISEQAFLAVATMVFSFYYAKKQELDEKNGS